ncbi:hypothetical protein HAHE_05300 [Haloferula helveola]|uniref:DUF2007 domain-containing protein n=1 Tax=Haloferula helveola TaxID=490095 RepID=A0ABM7RHX3_9BACT|nr:hypothetical protein HAHE_05300 [Haloferula helveola]
MEDDLIELQRFRHGEPLKELADALKLAGIEFRRSSTAPTFDLSTIGSDRESEVIISVAKSDYPAARSSLENLYADSPLPEDHHLLTASDEDLIEILSHESEWSAFDVAHARKMVAERGIEADEIHRQAAQRLKLLEQGRQASRLLVLSGYGFAILAACGLPALAVLGGGIGWSLCSMKNKTIDGTFPWFDQQSRASGVIMVIFSMFAAAIGIAAVRLQLGLF